MTKTKKPTTMKKTINKKEIIKILDDYSDDTGTFNSHLDWNKIAEKILSLSFGDNKVSGIVDLLPSTSQRESDKDQICFYAYNRKKKMEGRLLMEVGFELGYNYLLEKLKELKNQQ